MTPVFAMGRLQNSVCMNFPERKLDKEPSLSGCTTNGIISGTLFPLPCAFWVFCGMCLHICAYIIVSLPPCTLTRTWLLALTHPTKNLYPSSLLWKLLHPKCLEG